MGKISNVIMAVEDQQPVNPPDTLVDRVMVKDDQSAIGKIKRFILYRQKTSPDAAVFFRGRIASHRQCAFLLLMVGFFYLVAGVITTWGFYDDIAGGNINAWLKMQPYITIGSAVFILSAVYLIIHRPQWTAFIKYALIVHAFFILVNALILESILSLPIALVFVLILSMLAIGFSVLLIGSIRSF